MFVHKKLLGVGIVVQTTVGAEAQVVGVSGSVRQVVVLKSGGEEDRMALSEDR